MTFKRRRKYYGIGGYSLSNAEFKKVMGEKSRGEYKELQQTFNLIEAKAIKIIANLPAFTFEKFEKKFFKKSFNVNYLNHFTEFRPKFEIR